MRGFWIFWGIDWKLLAPVAVLIVLSLTTLSSINVIFLKSQLLFLFLSAVAFLFFSQVNYQMLKFYRLPFYIVSLIMLIMILFVGVQIRGATRWFDVIGIRVQLSEVLKPFLLLSFSSFLAQEGRSLKTFGLTLVFLAPLTILIFLQPDLGNALVFVATVMFVLVVFGFPLLWFFLTFLLFVGLLPLAWRLLHAYQRERILTFLYPAKDPLGTSYNALQSIITVGSGMLLGKGFLETTQSSLRFLPERHSDFIFAALSEGLGFVGAFLVCACFAFLFYRMYRIFYQAEDMFGKVFALSAFCLTFIQVFLNIGMNIGIVPVVGIALPFMSYGGSSLLANFILLGLLSSIQKVARQERVLEIR